MEEIRKYSKEEGELLVKAARNTLELLVKSTGFKPEVVKKSMKDNFKESRGVFVTLRHYHTNEIRGHMGFLLPEFPLYEGIVDATIGAATKDPKFIPVTEKELEDTILEVSILSRPELLKGSETKRLSSIKLGRDGMMIEYGLYKGHFMPEEIEEKKWTKKDAFEELCSIAKIPKTYWTQPNVRLYRFEVQTFKEEEPNGKVVEREILKTAK